MERRKWWFVIGEGEFGAVLLFPCFGSLTRCIRFLSFPKVLNDFQVLGLRFDGDLPIDGLVSRFGSALARSSLTLILPLSSSPSLTQITNRPSPPSPSPLPSLLTSYPPPAPQSSKRPTSTPGFPTRISGGSSPISSSNASCGSSLVRRRGVISG